jgi:hypothetical protein
MTPDAHARVDQSLITGSRGIARTNNPSRISRTRFAQKTGFGERRRDAKPVSTKIFLLPKTATQSPRKVLLADFGESRRHRSNNIR